MNKIAAVSLACTGVLLLTGCTGKKVGYDEFHEAALKADDALGEVTLKSASMKSEGKVSVAGFSIDCSGTLKLKYVDGSLSIDQENSDLENIAAYAALATFVGVRASTMSNSDSRTFYTGPLSVTEEKDDKKTTWKFDQYGNLTYYKGELLTLTGNYSYEKK